ncbi:MAG: hypothetical protein WC466_09290 [Candidatus Izemoplasmatales bacterium]
MIVTNNTPKKRWFKYKINGVVFNVPFNAYETIDIIDLTSTSQILENTYERRIRHIEDKFGYNFTTPFEVPGDPDFPTFTVTSSSANSLGAISPLGIRTVSKGEDIGFTMTPASDQSFSLTSYTTNSSYGWISPSGITSVSGYCYLNQFTLNGSNFVSAVTGNVSATTTYNLANVFEDYTVVSSFKLSSSQLFTMTATTAPAFVVTAATTNDTYGGISPSGNSISTTNYYYLSSLDIDGTDYIGSVTGTTSATTTYNLSPTDDHTINATFSYSQENKSFAMNASAVTFSLTALTQGESGGTISPSGITVDSNSYNYLSSFLVDGTEQISAVTGTYSGTCNYALTVSTNHYLNPVYSFMTGSTTFTMTPESSYYLKSLFIESSDQVSGVTGSVSGACTYNLQNIASGMSIEALFIAYGS